MSNPFNRRRYHAYWVGTEHREVYEPDPTGHAALVAVLVLMLLLGVPLWRVVFLGHL